MQSLRRTFIHLLIGSALGMAGHSYAQKNDVNTYRFVVPYTSGGTADPLARAIANQVSTHRGAQAMVENKPGGGGVIGAQAALSAPADGKTVLLVAASFVIQPQLLDNPPFDPVRDFMPVTFLASNPHVLIVNAALPVSNLKEFIAWSKAQKDKPAYASFGPGSSGHLGFERLKKAAGIDLIHVPYKGAGPALQDLIGGQVSAMLADLPGALSLIKAGRVKAIALGSKERAHNLPDLPTFTEAGVPGFESGSWYGFVVRTGTPPEAVTTLRNHVLEALRNKSLRDTLEGLGVDIAGTDAEAFKAHLARETARYAEAIRLAGLK